MVDRFAQQDLEELLTIANEPCVSIFMTTHHISGREIREDMLAFKNLLKDAKRQIKDKYRYSRANEEMIERAERMIDDEDFWKHQATGLAVFMTPEYYRHYRVPLAVENMAVVRDQFEVQPLLSLLVYDQDFYVLALSRESARLIYGDRQGYKRVEVPDLPENIRSANWFVETERMPQFAQGAPRGQHPGSYHGQGEDTRAAIPRLIEYLHQINKAVSHYLRRKDQPLILAAPNEIAGVYRRVNDYRNLLDESIDRNIEALTDEELYLDAYKLMRPIMTQPINEAQHKYALVQAHQPHRVSSDLAEITHAAEHGRVDTLFVGQGRELSNNFYEEIGPGKNLPLSAIDRQASTATLFTLRSGGTVLPVEPTELPAGNVVAAIFRY